MKKLDQVLNEFLPQTAALFFKALHRLSLYLPNEVGSSKSLKCVEVNELKKENIISARAFFGTFPGRHFSYDVNTFMGKVNTVQKEQICKFSI